MTESELSALLDAHDSLVTAYVDSSLTFSEFVSAYGDFPHNYALDGHSGTADERADLRFFRQRSTCECRTYCRGFVRPTIPRTFRTMMPAASFRLSG